MFVRGQAVCACPSGAVAIWACQGRPCPERCSGCPVFGGAETIVGLRDVILWYSKLSASLLPVPGPVDCRLAPSLAAFRLPPDDGNRLIFLAFIHMSGRR
ncbi:hypothetical protein PCLA_08f0236 [Pseudomonas citronellolis]|nr:hypothetical protein PCLA_08f0236 [Pseudomonas citronellolis]